MKWMNVWMKWTNEINEWMKWMYAWSTWMNEWNQWIQGDCQVISIFKKIFIFIKLKVLDDTLFHGFTG